MMQNAEDYLPLEAPRMFAGVEEKLSFFGGASALAVSMLGTGIAAFPFAFALCGYVYGLVVLLFLGVLSQLSYTCLMRCADQMRVASYTDALIKLPAAWSYYSNGALVLMMLFGMAAYVIITTDIIRSVAMPAKGFSDEPLLLRRPVLFAGVIALMFPVCLSRTMHALTSVNSYCTVAICVVALLIIWESCSIYASETPPPISSTTADASSILVAMPIMGCAMCGQQNLCQIYAELVPEAKPKGSLVSLTACVAVLALYISVGGAGYAAFGDYVGDDVASMIAERMGEADVVVLIQSLLASFIILKTPLVILPLRALTLSFIAPGMSVMDLSTRQNVGLTAALFTCAYAIMIALPSLARILAVIGVACVIPLSFIIPARLSWSLEKPRPVVRCLTLGIAGALVCVLATIATAKALST